MAVKGDINYPSEMKERSKMLMMINTKQAISEFVLGNKYVLNSKEVAYLETIA